MKNGHTNYGNSSETKLIQCNNCETLWYPGETTAEDEIILLNLKRCSDCGGRTFTPIIFHDLQFD